MDLQYAMGVTLVSMIAFAVERDYIYVAITLIVLAVLAFGLAGGHL